MRPIRSSGELLVPNPDFVFSMSGLSREWYNSEAADERHALAGGFVKQPQILHYVQDDTSVGWRVMELRLSRV